MTREEAHNILYNGLIDAPSEQEWCTAFRMAIEALEQEQELCEDEDIISRENVITTLRADPFFTCSGDQLNAIRIVEGMPSVTPQLKTGHWISHREHCENLGVIPSGLGAYKWCSNCDCGIDAMEWHRNPYNYCPNCGAKMEGVQE